MPKSAEAFRTISEVAEWLDTPTHVLRFWESKFPQVKPVKRAGGRRYYRPADMELLSGIKQLLHEEGVTIRGVQKILREQGVRHVCALSNREIEGYERPEPADAIGVTKAKAAPAPSAPTPTQADPAKVVTLRPVPTPAPAPSPAPSAPPLQASVPEQAADVPPPPAAQDMPSETAPEVASEAPVPAEPPVAPQNPPAAAIEDPDLRDNIFDEDLPEAPSLFDDLPEGPLSHTADAEVLEPLSPEPQPEPVTAQPIPPLPGASPTAHSGAEHTLARARAASAPSLTPVAGDLQPLAAQLRSLRARIAQSMTQKSS